MKLSGLSMPQLNAGKAGKLMLPLRVAQATFTCVVLGTSAFVSNWWTHYWRDMPPSQIGFLVFSSVWTLLTLAYLIVAPMKFPRAAPKLAQLGADALAMMFWFAGFVAMAVFLSSRICFGNVCHVAKTSVAFAAFEWLLFAMTTAIAGLNAFRSRGTSTATAKMVEDPPMSSGPPSPRKDKDSFERVNVE
jgi:hypothetical protein